MLEVRGDRLRRRRRSARRSWARSRSWTRSISPACRWCRSCRPAPPTALFLNGVGIPTYGIEPLFVDPDLGHIHGLNEYVSVKSLLDARAFLYDLVKIYSTQK